MPELRGDVSPIFLDAVQVVDEIELRSPLGGHFIWRPSDDGPLMLVGAGFGAVPLAAMILHRHVPVPDLAVVFDASPNPYLVLDRNLNIAAANAAYLASVNRKLFDIVGRWAWEAFPTDENTPRQAIDSSSG